MNKQQDYGIVYIGLDWPWHGSISVKVESDVIPAAANTWGWSLIFSQEEGGNDPLLTIDAITTVYDTDGNLVMTFSATAEATVELVSGKLYVDLTADTGSAIFAVAEARGFIVSRYAAGADA